ncbi:MAG TPA: hypothetical protein VIF14_17065 [Alphaproteobacteria bacterium]
MTLAWTAVLLVALWALWCWPWFLGGLTIPWDSKNHFYPQLRFLAASLHGGQSAAWAPYVYSGHLQLADPQSLIFSPVMLALALLDAAPTFAHMDAATLAGLLPGGIGMLLVFRRSGWRLEGGLVAGLAFMFGGASAARLQHTTQILSYGMLPLALWLLMEALHRRSVRHAVAFAVAAAIMAVGRDQVAFLGCLVLAGYAVYAAVTARGRLRFLASRAIPLAAAAISGAALLAVPLLLTAEMAASSNRPSIAYGAAAVGSLAPWSLLTIAIPDYFGTLHEADLYWGPGAFAWGDYANQTDRAQTYLYGGAIPALLCLYHGIAGGRLGAGAVRFFVIVFAVAALYALGDYTPAFRALYEIPGVALYRRPADAVFIVGFALAVLGGYLAHRLIAEGPPKVSGRAWALLGLAAAIVVAAALAFASEHGHLGVSARAAAIAAGFLVLAAVAVILAARWRTTPALAGAILAATLAADLAWHNSGMAINARDPGDYAPLDGTRPDALAADLARRLAAERAAGRHYRVEILGLGGPWQNAPLALGLEATLGYNPLRWSDYEKATGAGEGSDLPRRAFTPLFPSYRSAMADMLGIRYLAAGAPIEGIDPKLRPGDLAPLGRIGKAYLYANPRALPRARLATAIAVADTRRLIETGSWPADPREAVVLERMPPEWPSVAPPRGGTASAKIELYRHDEVVVAVDTAGPAMLVLHDLFHPAWRARLDGAPAAVYRANVLFRAVFVPAGRHTVRFTFHPIASAIERAFGAPPRP